MSEWYDRSGKRIPVIQAGDIDKRVAETWLSKCWVSTVWLGLDHNFGDGPPMIFETMIFPACNGEVTDWSEVYVERYATEDAALEGHDRAVMWAREHAEKP